jgi:hypothetical protein
VFFLAIFQDEDLMSSLDDTDENCGCGRNTVHNSRFHRENTDCSSVS